MGESSNDDIFVRLLELSINTESELRVSVRNTLNFYTTTILSVIGGTFFVAKDIQTSIVQILAYFIGGLMVLMLSLLGFQHVKSDYRRQIEQIVLQAKAEDQLDLSSTKYYGKSYWTGEPFIIPDYLSTRRKYSESQGFINLFLEGGDMRIVKQFFSVFAVIGAIIIGLGIYLSYIS